MDKDSIRTAKFNYSKNASSNQSFRQRLNTKEKDKTSNSYKMQENEGNEVIEFSFANNTNYREIKQISDKSSSSKRESLSDSLQSSKYKEQKPKFPSRNIISKDFSSKALTNTINNIRKKDKQNINSINNTINFSNINFNNKSNSNHSKDDFDRISAGTYSKHSLRNQKNDSIRINNKKRDNLGKNNVKTLIQINKNNNNTQKKIWEFNNTSNTRRIEDGINNTNNSNTSLNEEIRLLISAIKSSNDLMEMRQKRIDENLEKLVKTQEMTNKNIIETNKNIIETNKNIIETNNMLKKYMESKGISVKDNMKMSKKFLGRK